MSAFLAPIHFWMYDKILVAQKITFELEKNFKDKLNVKEIDSLFPAQEEGELEEIIDLSNIHGWLHLAVSQVEIRFAYVVKTLLDLGVSIEEIKSVVYKFGETFPNYKINSPKEAYELLMDTLLDGLPCDVSISIKKDEENQLIFLLHNDIHRQYFSEFDMENSIYHEIREAFVNGLLEKYSMKYKNLSESEKLIERNEN